MAVIDKHGLFTLDDEFIISAEVKAVKGNIVRIFHNDLGKPHLSAAEDLAYISVNKMYSDTLIVAGVVKRAAHHSAVGVIARLIVAVIDNKTRAVGVKAATDEGVVSAVIYAAV